MNQLSRRTGHDEWGTPLWLFRQLDAEFRLTLDVCARPGLEKCSKYFSPADDGLVQDWRGQRCWMNPPYSRGQVARWVSRALHFTSTWPASRRTLVVALLPVSSDADWWHDLVDRAEIRFIRGRLRFDGVGRGTSSPFPCAIAILTSGLRRPGIGNSIDARGMHRVAVPSSLEIS